MTAIARAVLRFSRNEIAGEIRNPSQRAEVKREIFSTLGKNASVMALGNMLAGMLFVANFMGSPLFWVAMGWYVVFLTIVTFTINRPVMSTTENVQKEKWLKRTEIPMVLVIAISWSILPLLTFGGADPSQRLLLTALPFGLIGTVAIYLISVPRSANIFNYVVTGFMLTTFALNWHPSNLYVATMLLVYSIFVSAMVNSNSSFIAERFINGFKLSKSNQTIRTLLQEYEDDGHEWLWETDASLKFVNIGQKFCEITGLGADRIEGMGLDTLGKADVALNSIPISGPRKMMEEAISSCHPFKNLSVSAYHKGPNLVWWQMSGRPQFDDDGNFMGYRGVGSDITEAKKAENRIAKLAMTDSLTGLPNRENFRQQLVEVMERGKNNGERAALFMLDLDKFKHINDTLGHPAGDELLERVGQRLRSHCGDAKVISRLGGDEFAILFENIGDDSNADVLMQRLLDSFRTQFNIAGRQLGVNTSIGLALAPDHGKNDEELVKNADLAMYRAKSKAGDTFHVFDAEMDLQLRERYTLAQELQSALLNDELQLLYQPLVGLRSGDVVGYEALIRWENPRLGNVKPQVFIPIAEENGLIIDIGKWVIRKACAEAASWNNDCRVAVNLSPMQFVGVQLETVVALALSDSGLRPGRLELEITESSLLANGEVTLATLKNLRKLGISIALDDFGTGYSSLSYLTHFPFDKIKIDRSFLRHEVLDEDNTAVVRAMLGLAKALKLRTTVEGVEHQHQLDFLRDVGCDEMQGYLFSRPLHPDKLRSVYHDTEGEPVKVKIRAG